MCPSNNPSPNQDDQLADFVDRVRNAGFLQVDSNLDDELRGLEETILRLNRVFPNEPINEETIKRMQADFAIRKRRQDAQEQTRRQIWLSALYQSPVALAAAAFIIIGFLLILSMPPASVGPAVSGAAGSQFQPVYLLPILGVLILLAFWLGRRK